MNTIRRRISSVVMFSLFVLVVACGSGGGGENNIDQSDCSAGLIPRGRWTTEIFQTSLPPVLKYCPAIVRQTITVNPIVWVDLLGSQHSAATSTLFVTRAWTKRLVAGSVLQDVDSAISYNNAPYLTPSNEQPLRAIISLSYEMGRTPASGQHEVDSIDISYLDTNGDPAGAYVKFPVRVDPNAGQILGGTVAFAQVAKEFRIQPAWDTAGYRYQWYADGTPISERPTLFSLTHFRTSVRTHYESISWVLMTRYGLRQ